MKPNTSILRRSRGRLARKPVPLFRLVRLLVLASIISTLPTVAFSASVELSYDGNGNLTAVQNATASVPIFITQPFVQIAESNDAINLSVNVASDTPVTYQWQLNNTNITGATGDTLLVTNLTAAISGNYTVIITNAHGSVTSVATPLRLPMWSGQGDGVSWSDPQNWFNGTQPNSNSDVLIAPSSDIPAIQFTSAAGVVQIRSLTSSAPINITGGTLQVATTVQSSTIVTLAGGTIQGGTITATPSSPFSAGRFGNGLLLNAGSTAQALQVPNGMSAGAVLTLEVAFKTTVGGVLFGAQNSPINGVPTSYVPALYIGTDGKLRGEFWQGNIAPITSAGAVNDGLWHHVALVGNTNTQSLYLDGVLVGTKTGTVNSQTTPYNQFGTGETSNWPGGNGGWYPFIGEIDEARLWNVARSAAQIQASANAALTGAETGLAGYWPLDEQSGSTAADHSPNGKNGTVLYASPLQATSGTLDGVTLNSDLAVLGTVTVTNGLTLANATLTVQGTLNVTGGLTLNNGNLSIGTAGGAGSVYFQGTQNLGGTGQVVFAGSSTSNVLYAQGDNTQAGAAVLTIGSGVTVNATQNGTVAGRYSYDSVVNMGTVNANTAGVTLTVGSPAPTTVFSNNGTMVATAGTLNLAGNFTTARFGTVKSLGGAVNITGTLDNTGSTLNAVTGSWNLAGGTIKGGTINLTSGSPWFGGRFGNGLLLNTGNTTAQALQIPNGMALGTVLTVEVSFETTGGGVLFGMQGGPINGAPAGWAPVLYVGTDGKLRGKFYNGSTSPITSAGAVNEGQWHHAALVGNGNTQSLYLDGALVGTVAGTINQQGASYNQFGTGDTAGWPAGNGGWYPFAGQIDEARLWNVARTQAQIQASANAALTGAETGLAGYWPLDEQSGSTAADHSPNGKNATVVSASTLQASSGTLDGVTLYSDLTVTGNLNVKNGLTLNNADLIVGSGSGTFNVYFQATQTLGGTGQVVFAGSSGQNFLYAQGDNTQAGAAVLTIDSGITVNATQNGTLAGRYSYDSVVNKGAVIAGTPGTTLTIGGAMFTNQGTLSAPAGTLAITATNWTTSGATLASSGVGTLNLGGNFTLTGLAAFNRNGGSVNITGTLDNTGGTINAATGPWNLAGGTIKGGTINLTSVSPWVGGRFGNGLLLNTGNTTQALQIPNGMALGTVLTVEVSFKTTAGGVIFGMQGGPINGAPAGWAPVLYVGTDGKLRGKFYNGSTSPITSAGAVNEGQWHHAALVGNGNTQSLYLDGALVGTVAGTINQQGASYNQFGTGDTAGTWPAGNGGWYPFIGEIDEARLWNVARSAAQIQASANAALTGAETGLAGYWPLDEQSGSTAADHSPNGKNATVVSPSPIQVSSGILDGVILNCDLTVTGNLNVKNGLTLNNADFIIGSGSGTFNVYFQGTQTLGGTGQVTFAGSSGANYLYAQGNNTLAGAAVLTIEANIGLINSPNGHLQGYYSSYDSLINLGLTNASLAGISLSSGILTPNFSSGTFSYAINVPTGLASFTVTPTVTNPSATVKVNGVTVPSGGASSPISVAGGGPVNIVVTAENGLTIATYSATITPLGNLPYWRLSHFGTTLNIGNAADTYDFDRDGISNLMEFAINSDPTASNKVPGGIMINGSSIEFTYPRSKAATSDGVAFIVEWSDDLSLGDWSNSLVVETLLTDDGTTQQVKATMPAGTAGKRFVRLRVVSGP